MSDANFYTFLTGGLGLLVALMTLVAWHLWRMREDARAGRASALEGVAHELRINLQRMVAELSQVSTNPGAGPDVLLPIRHPQLDGVNSSLITANRNGIAVLGSTYQELEARKLGLRAVLAQGREPGTTLDDAMDAAVNGIAALYIWEVHKGARAQEIGTVRSWSVRDWMKGHGFKADAFPGMHLRDEVVERLRLYGVTLTPRPLTHTAWEYYSMQYDRHADVRGPLGRRRTRTDEQAVEQQAEAAAPKRGGLFGMFGRGKDEAEAAENDAAETYDTVAAGEVPAGVDNGAPEPAATEEDGYPAGDQPPRPN
ncbi:MAG: hypothetical protein ACK4MQ_08300 [Hyphomonas sp.]